MKLKIKPEVILSGRNTNDNMVSFIGNEIIKRVSSRSKCLFLGVTFKENVPDLRNSKSLELMNFLKKKNVDIVFYDPYIKKLNNFRSLDFLKRDEEFDSIVLSVPHDKIKNIFQKKFFPLLKKTGFFFDIKGKFRKDVIYSNYWSL